MLLYAYLLLAVELAFGQKQSFREGNRFAPIPYYNLGPKPNHGVGVLQDLSNARIISNEPFIISFEFPKLTGSGDSRKNRYGAKTSRSKSQRKKNRKPRQFRHVVAPEEEILERRKRLEIMRRPPAFRDLQVPSLIADDRRSGKSLLKTSEDPNPSERTSYGYGRFMNFEAKSEQTEGDSKKQDPVQAVNPFQEVVVPDENEREEMESIQQKNWENIKKKWISLFAKQKEGNDNEVDENEEKLKIMSRKMWANCQLLKLLKAPQRNPYFYKLLPPNYPALIMDEEKQLQCNQFYDITDLAKDKQMVAEKIEQLERILSTGNDSDTRRKREAPEDELKSEEENTLQDETLQGKSEGEVRSDRSKRTKERQHIRRERSKDSPKEKSRRMNRRAKTSTKETRRSKSDKQETSEGDNVKRARRKHNVDETPTKKLLNEIDLKPEEETTEKKREKQEIRMGKDNSLQDLFSPSEVNKVIRQKEMEANIFDKVLRAMRKFEDNNPYDESFRPQKRESGNSTENAVVTNNDAGEEGWELEDTIKKLAKIFKILGVKAEAAKRKGCTDCHESGESSSEESNEDGKVLKKNRIGKSPKCTCAECPFCQNCLQCFKECKKAALAAKTSLSNNQSPLSSPHMTAGKGSNAEKDIPLTSTDRNGRERDSIVPHEEQVTMGERHNVKLERMYRSKLPPSRDLVRVYFDNPENKLLVWTKRGRRTMPWGPLTSDLQLYRDRARQILKSAEDILHRIRETEDKIHTGQYDENEQGPSDKTQKINNMDDIIKKVVNEDETKNMLRTPWEAELEKGVADGKVVQSNHASTNFEGMTFNIFKDGIPDKTELPKESLTLDVAKGDDSEGDKLLNDESESSESYEVGRVEAAEPNPDMQNRVDDIKSFKEEDGSEHEDMNTDTHRTQVDTESVEAAVLPIEKQEEAMNHKIFLNDHDNDKNPGQIAEVKQSTNTVQGWKEKEEDEDDDIPAKVEAINQDKAKYDIAWKIKSKANDRQAEKQKLVDYITKKLGKLQNVHKKEEEKESEGEEKDTSDALENVKAQSVESQSTEKEYDAKVEGARKTSTEESSAEEGYSGEWEQAGRAFSGESEEVKETYNEGSSVEKEYSGESQSIEGSNAVEKEAVKNVNRGESEEVEGEFNGQSEDGKKVNSGGSESVEMARGYSSESEDVEKSAEKMIGELKKILEREDGTSLPKKSWQETADTEKNAENVLKELKTAIKFETDQKDPLIGKPKGESSEVEKTEYEKDESGEEPLSYEDAEDSKEDVQEVPPNVKELSIGAAGAEGKSHEEKNPFEEHIKSIEENYVIKGVKQTKEEKEAILKALLNVEKKQDEKVETPEEIVQEIEAEALTEGKGNMVEVKVTEKPLESEGASLTSVVQHLEKGYIDEKDFDVIKKLDESQFDLLVGEMKKNDEKGMSVHCETRMKLCQAVCSCRNGTDSDLTKYEIIKGFLGWLKDLNVDKMAPINA